METKKVASIEEAKQLFDRLDEKAQIAFAEYWENQIKWQNAEKSPCDGSNHTQGHIKNITQSV